MTDLDGALDSTILKWMARVILPALLVIGSTAGAWVLNRAVDTVDRQGIKIEKIGAEVSNHTSSFVAINNYLETITRQRDTQIQDIKSSLQDHETRVRILERGPR